MRMTMDRRCEPRLPVGSGLALDVPVYVRAADLASAFGVHSNYVSRAMTLGYLVAAAYVGDTPLFDRETGLVDMRAYLATRPRSKVARRALDAKP